MLALQSRRWWKQWEADIVENCIILKLSMLLHSEDKPRFRKESRRHPNTFSSPLPLHYLEIAYSIIKELAVNDLPLPMHLGYHRPEQNKLGIMRNLCHAHQSSKKWS